MNVLTANYDLQRTNSNLQETILNQQNVNTSNFGKLGYFPVDGEIYAQPLYASGIQITGQGLHNVVYVATMHNSVYAIDADQPGSTTALWQVNLGPSVPSWVLNFTDILPEVGSLSTPVIDLTRQVMYVVSDTLSGGSPVFQSTCVVIGGWQRNVERSGGDFRGGEGGWCWKQQRHGNLRRGHRAAAARPRAGQRKGVFVLSVRAATWTAGMAG